MGSLLQWFRQGQSTSWPGNGDAPEVWDLHACLETAYVPLKSDAQEPYMKMTHPLSAYFVSSGHNSYLTGNQLNSYGGVKTIEKCLLENCRVVELDVYNKQVHFSGPVCKHGGTLTPPISFQACVEAVRRYAFKNSPYPVIVTIENHTDLENQKHMARILRDVLQDMLFIPTPKELQSPWKSPEELKHKVLIRAKIKDDWPFELSELVYIRNIKLNKERWSANLEGNARSTSLQEQKIKMVHEKVFAADLKVSRYRLSYEGWSSRKSGSPPTQAPALAPQIQDRKPRLAEDSSIERAHGGRFAHQQGSWARLERAESPAQEIALDPDADVAAAVDSLEDVYAYTSKHLLRVYPAGVRVDSSNYDPTKGWALGASLVAFNWQTQDEHMWTYKAMFTQNAGCGYVLKPDFMLGGLTGFSRSPSIRDLPYCLQVSLYNAHCDQHAAAKVFKQQLFLMFQIVGMPIDRQDWRANASQTGGALFIEEKREFELYHPELAVIKITLWYEESAAVHKLQGHWEVPVGTLAEGDFKIHLTDKKERVRNDRWVKLGFKWLVEGMRASSEPGASMKLQGVDSPFDVAPRVSGSGSGSGSVSGTCGELRVCSSSPSPCVHASLDTSGTPGTTDVVNTPASDQQAPASSTSNARGWFQRRSASGG